MKIYIVLGSPDNNHLHTFVILTGHTSEPHFGTVASAALYAPGRGYENAGLEPHGWMEPDHSRLPPSSLPQTILIIYPFDKQLIVPPFASNEAECLLPLRHYVRKPKPQIRHNSA